MNENDKILFNQKKHFLSELEEQLNELQEINLSISNVLDKHNKQLSDLNISSDKLIYNFKKDGRY